VPGTEHLQHHQPEHHHHDDSSVNGHEEHFADENVG
jgi:hypothetical protein